MTSQSARAPARDQEPVPDRLSLEVVYRPLTAIAPYAKNPREHPKSQIDKLCKSFQAYGMVAPILIDQDGEIIAGHGRYLAAKQLGLAQIPTITISHLSPAARRKLRIADNRHSDNSSFSRDLLKAELIELMGEEIDLDCGALGFEVAEIDVILHEDKTPDDDELPDAPATPRAKPGDIWRLGDHLVGCGDARDEEFVRKVMGGLVADMAFLDAPYNVSIQGHVSRSGEHREFAMASGEMSEGQFVSFLQASLSVAAKVTRDGGIHFVCMDHHHIDELSSAARPIYGARLNIVVWRKSNPGMGSFYRSHHELVLVYRVGTAQPVNNVQLGRYGRSRTNVWDYQSVNTAGSSRAKELKLHPTTKPVAMVADAIKDVTKPGDVVLDTFLGSGTSLVAAERVGRRFRGTEIDPLYVDIALERWASMTGRTPLLEHREEGWGNFAPPPANSNSWGSQGA